MRQPLWLSLIAAVAGIAVWALVCLATGKAEAWDSGIYFAFGIPALAMVSLALGLLEPRGWWRWAVIPFAAQLLWMLASSGHDLGLLPVGIACFAVLSIPSLASARLGAWLRGRHGLRRSGQSLARG